MPETFLPTTREEMLSRGWTELDVLFVTGDAYVDHPAFGVPLLARLLESQGFRVGIVAQPDWRSPEAFSVMGRPRLCAAVSAGAMDSMVNHYTAARRIRRDDAYTPGGRAGNRPNRAVIVYSAMLKGVFKGLPLLIGGIEASLRRFAHYDYWEDKVRRSILCDSKADLLLFGMGERSLLEICRRLSDGEGIDRIRDVAGTAYLSANPPEPAEKIPSFEDVSSSGEAFARAFRQLTEASLSAERPLVQEHGNRWLCVNPPSAPLSAGELDALYALPFTRAPHPAYRESIPAFEQIRNSITTHRGCYGGCSFCAITHHQGKTIQSRSSESILNEIDTLCRQDGFRGTLSDLGGPTANMFGTFCKAASPCTRPSCLHPSACAHLETSDRRAAGLLREVRKHPAVKHAFVASGIRYDLLKQQSGYFSELLEHHVGGLLKIAPEHCSPEVTKWMRKPGPEQLDQFLDYYFAQNRSLGKRRGVVPYFIAGHPGSTLKEMLQTALFLKKRNLRVEQVQEFTPTPGTYATCLYHTGIDPYSGKQVPCARSDRERRLQKALLLHHRPELKNELREALRRCGREELLSHFLDNRPENNRTAKVRQGDRNPAPRRKRKSRRNSK